MTEKHWDVYVSYKNNPDGEVALNLVEALEKAGLKCWIAPPGCHGDCSTDEGARVK